MTPKTKKILFLSLAFVFLAGILVRLLPLDSHFGHVDDLGVAKTVLKYQQDYKSFAPARILKNPVLSLLYQWSGVAREWTYAPAQFVLTYYLIHSGQTYREIVFRGRLPSCLFGCLGLFMMFWFYRRYDRLQTPAALMSVTLLAFSWENIIYAQQMGSYAIGVFSAAALLYLLWKNFQIRQPRFSHMLGIVISLAVLSYTQYQVLFFIPAFLAVLFLYYAIKNCRDLPMLLVRFTSAGLCYALLIFPLYFFFLLKKKETAGITWNVGPNQEFQFLLPQGPALEKLSYAASFFAKNSFLVLSNNFAFIPETHPLYRPFAFLFAAFVLFGIFSLVFSRSLRKKMLALFFFLAAATWACLVVKNKIALSPTRHSLILLPFMVMMFSEGWIRFVHFFKRNAQVFRSALTGGLWTSILIFFALSCVPVLKERRDPFHEGELRRLFEEYRPGGVIATDYTINLNLMHSIKSRFNYFESETMDTPLAAPDADLNTVAFISHRQPLDRETFNLMRFKVNLRQRMQGKNHFIAGELEDYQVIYSKAIKSDTEVEFSRRTRNGSNNLFLTILRKA